MFFTTVILSFSGSKRGHTPLFGTTMGKVLICIVSHNITFTTKTLIVRETLVFIPVLNSGYFLILVFFLFVCSVFTLILPGYLLLYLLPLFLLGSLSTAQLVLP